MFRLIFDHDWIIDRYQLSPKSVLANPVQGEIEHQYLNGFYTEIVLGEALVWHGLGKNVAYLD